MVSAIAVSLAWAGLAMSGDSLPAPRHAVDGAPQQKSGSPAPVKSARDIAHQEAVASETVATAREIEPTGARTVLDAVASLVPGAFVTRRGVMGYGIATNGTGGVSIRGIGGQPNTNVLVIVDGRPDYQGLMGHPLPDFYTLSDAASVSVTEGPASGDRPSSAFRNQDGTAAIGYDLSDNWKTSLQGRYGHFYVEDPGPVTAPLTGSFATVGRGGFSANLDNSGGSYWGYARVYSSHGRHVITDGFRSVDRTTGVRIDESFAVSPKVVVQAGTDIVNYGGRALNMNTKLDYGSHGATSAAGFARAQWAPAGALRAHAGVRYEHNTVFGSIAVPEAGATLAFGRYSVAAEVGRGFRNPTIRELYLFPAPNPLLQPERLWNYQVSFQARPSSGVSLSPGGTRTLRWRMPAAR